MLTVLLRPSLRILPSASVSNASQSTPSPPLSPGNSHSPYVITAAVPNAAGAPVICAISSITASRVLAPVSETPDIWDGPAC